MNLFIISILPIFWLVLWCSDNSCNFSYHASYQRLFYWSNSLISSSYFYRYLCNTQTWKAEGSSTIAISYWYLINLKWMIVLWMMKCSLNHFWSWRLNLLWFWKAIDWNGIQTKDEIQTVEEVSNIYVFAKIFQTM